MKKLLANIVLVIFSVVFFFLLLETYFALFSSYKLTHRPYHEKYDPVMGWVNKPLKDDDVQFEFAPRMFFHVRHNSLGLRGGETHYQKPAEIKRILFVGDSFFWGYGVEDDEVLTAVLQTKMGNSTEVLNGGVTGYGTDQELLWLQNEGLKYQPDVVVAGLTVANDFDEIASSINYYYPKPIFMLEGGRLVLKNVPVPKTRDSARKNFSEPSTLFGKIKKFLRYHTHTYNFIVSRLNSRPDWRLFFLNLGLAEEYTVSLQGLPELKNPPEDLERIEFRLLKEMARTTENAHAKFLLVIIPEKERDDSAAVRYEGARDGANADNAYYSAKIRAFCQAEHIAELDLLPLVRALQRNGEVLYHQDKYDHHWTPAGHRFAAEAIFDALRKERWIPDDLSTR